ncbi:MAG TPA: hypothetical protein PKY50_06040 [Candidatus Competibacter sp.]|nr:hypothetical protein [Candidatus Competibacter sp.]
MNAISRELRNIADIAEAGDKPHWAKAMRAGARQIGLWQPEIESARMVCDAADNLFDSKNRQDTELWYHRLREAVAAYKIRMMKASAAEDHVVDSET